MRVMLTNSNSLETGYLAGRYEHRIGHLYSPGGLRGPYEFMPFALDNGRFPAWSRGQEWDEDAFSGMLDRVRDSRIDPLWVLVPDVVADAEATLREWDKWCSLIAAYSWPLAFAAQDGHTPDDVPAEAAVVFVGGTTEWKRASLHDFCGAFPRVHVGRINTEKWLWECHDAGAESCDGTGWFRGDKVQLAGLRRYLQRSSKGQRPAQRLLRDA